MKQRLCSICGFWNTNRMKHIIVCKKCSRNKRVQYEKDYQIKYRKYFNSEYQNKYYQRNRKKILKIKKIYYKKMKECMKHE